MLVIGVVTHGNPPGQLARLARSLELAWRDLDARPRVLVRDHGVVGAPSAWPIAVERGPPGTNVGFGAGMNALMAWAFSAPAVGRFLCLNPDAVLHRDCLRELLAAAEATPGALVEARQFPEEHPKPYDPATGDTPWASGACLLVPRRVFEDHGGFDPGFFLDCEDVDLSWRVRAAGGRVVVAPRALVGHEVLNRPPDPARTRHTLLSARRLGHLWGSPRFRRWAEGELVARGLAAGGELPPLPARAQTSRPVAAGVADFEHLLTFARARWA